MANKQFSINDIINEQAQGLPLEEQKQTPPVNNNTELVRYKGGETVKDKNGNTITAPNNFVQNFLNKSDKANIQSTKPLTAKKGEPKYGYEWAEDAAQKVWDSGKSMDDVEAEMNKEWPLANAIIKDNESAALRASDSDKKDDYGKSVQYYEKVSDKDGSLHYRSPREQAEATLSRRYGFSLSDNPVIQENSPANPSSAVGFLHRTNLKKDWENFINLKGVKGVADFLNSYKNLRSKLLNLNALKSEKDLKKLGFNSQEDYDLATRYLIKSLDEKANSIIATYLGKNDKAETAKAEKAVTRAVKETPAVANNPSPTEVETAKAEKAVPESTEDVSEAAVPGNTEAANTEADEQPSDDGTFNLEGARLNTEATAQEKKAQEEADAIANKELTRKKAEKLEKKLEEAAKKKQQDLFDYEDWLKNPSIISGIFGKSGLSAARRVGLGLATLFAIFSDVAANYGKGINNNTDFKTAAMDQLNSTITKIQNSRAEAAGKLAARPYETATDNEEKLNKDYEKLRRLPTGTYIPKSALQAFIQESQIDTKEPISDSLYERFNSESRKGFIDSIKRNRTLKKAYLDKDDNLNADGELKFLNKQEQAIAQYKNVLGLSDERLSNINNLLEMDKKRAEVRSKVHDVIFQTNADYINAINAMEDENRALETSKLDFTEAKNLDAMLDLAQKNRNVISGLATSSANTTEGTSDTEASLNRFSEQGGIEKVNEELKKHGWQAELNGEVGANFPLKVVPISAEISAGGKWTSEQANKHLQSEYEKWTRDDQRSLSKARSLSAASGKNVDESYDEIINFLNSEKAKGAEADFNKVRQEVLESINNKIQYNKQVIDELREMREKERKFDTGENNSVSTTNPYVSMFNDVPTKDSNWYKYRLALS